jgi:FkbH-like protein
MSAVITPSPRSESLKLFDALNIVSRPADPTATDTFSVGLVCSFTPLHLQTFLTAELRLRQPSHHVKVLTGLFDDISGTLKDFHAEALDAVVIVLEWFDLDARLGFRRLSGWSPNDLPDIVTRAEAWLTHLRSLIDGFSSSPAIVISLPTLPLPPLFSTPGWQASVHELELRQSLWAFAAAIARHPNVRIVSDASTIGSAVAERLNLQSTLTTGFPYQTAHAARLAQLVARAVEAAPPKKGLITDLDNTLWRGTVGDDGVQKISWDLDHHSQAHGVYQQFLSALSEIGVLIGVASKNDPEVVDEAFGREDLLLPKTRIFPLAVTWGSKAQAVAQILKAWNVSADSVVFVDDNPTELEEVRAAHPGIECFQFSREPDAVYRLLMDLRDLFGKSTVSAEDRIRLDSLRSGVHVLQEMDDAAGFSESLLEHAQSELTLDFAKDPSDARALELINKTNQFNLNGRRIAGRAWSEFLHRPDTFVLTASYKDRFGPLGKIAVLAGQLVNGELEVTTWVMSCRAFARRIEHQCLTTLFDRFEADTARLDYAATARNGPLTRFLADIAGSATAPQVVVTADQLRAVCPKLFHRVIVTPETGHE